MQACCEAGNQEISVFVNVTGDINKICENLSDILGICASVDGLQDEDLFLGLEVAPLLTDPHIGILVGCRHLAPAVDVVLLDQVFPGIARGGFT